MVRARTQTVSITKCSIKRCFNIATQGSLCAKHHIAKWRMENPLKAAFTNLRENAKRRGKEFDLTFEQFCAFAIRTGYMKKKGRWAESWHIDRKEETLGYTIDNLQVLTNAQNVRKYLKYYYDEQNRRMVFSTKTVKPRKATKSDPF